MAEPDIIEGGAPPRRPWLGRLAAGVAVLALAGWLMHGRSLPSPPPDQTEPDAPSHVVGVELTEDLGTVLMPTRPPTLVDTARRSSVLIAGLPARADHYDLAELAGQGHLVTVSNAAGLTEAYLVEGAQARLVASGLHVVPGADGSSVLVTHADANGRRVQRYGLDGAPLGPPVSLAEHENLVYETVAGWVLVSIDGAQLREPHQPWPRGAFFTPYAATPTRLAYMPWEGGLVVAGLAPGGDYTSLTPAQPPAGSGALAGAALRSDGRLLAVHTVLAEAPIHTVQVLDLATGEWRTMPGTPVRVAGDEGALTMAWSGDVLTVVTANGDAVLWRPADGTVYAAPDQVTPRPL